MAAGHRPYVHKVDSKEQRRDSYSATKEEGGVLRTDWPLGQGIGDASRSFQLCWLIDKAGEEGQDRVSIVQPWNLCSNPSPQPQGPRSRYPFDC
jgi:hypothetical protein